MHQTLPGYKQHDKKLGAANNVESFHTRERERKKEILTSSKAKIGPRILVLDMGFGCWFRV